MHDSERIQTLEAHPITQFAITLRTCFQIEICIKNFCKMRYLKKIILKLAISKKTDPALNSDQQKFTILLASKNQCMCCGSQSKQSTKQPFQRLT